MIKKIVFDLDNTLLEWKNEYIYALENVVNNFNLEYDKEKIKEIDRALEDYEDYLIKSNKEDFLKFLNNRCKTNLSMEFLDKLIEEQGKCFDVYEGEKLETIKYLSKKYKLICISNWFTRTQKMRLEGAGIAKYFDIITGGDEHELKPSINAFSIIDNPKECIMIGDSLKKDIFPAIKLGMQAILITKKDVKEDSRYKIIRNIEELKEML